MPLKVRFQTVVLILVGVALLGGAGYMLRYFFENGYLRFNYPDKNRFPIRGIDISHHQGKIDWLSLRNEQFHFIYIKATEGGDHKDRRFKANWEGAARHGILRGAYHYFTFCKNGKAQAENFIATVPTEANTLPPGIDIEYAGNCKSRPKREELLAEVRVFAEELTNYYHRKPIFYVTEEIYADYFKGEINDFPLWIRDIYFEPKFNDRGGWVLWQYANRGRVQGINGPVDLNVFNGDVTAFRNLLIPEFEIKKPTSQPSPNSM